MIEFSGSCTIQIGECDCGVSAAEISITPALDELADFDLCEPVEFEVEMPIRLTNFGHRLAQAMRRHAELKEEIYREIVSRRPTEFLTRRIYLG